ncbi:MAG TPA: exodeoxyribonuclease VII large subunit [Longilinea sp.]|nr:exodeoxyribonuclease VII large subunit [Longilinea sp.]
MEDLPLFLIPQAALSVSDLNRYLREIIESDEVLRDVWVQGEISNLSTPGSGHIYFTLKDSAASLRCVIWKTNAFRLRQSLANGQLVEAHGYISIYEAGGQYQLYIDSLRLAGEGALFQEFVRLKNKLEAEGLFDPQRKRPIPPFPQRIGVVTSPTGAALQDILNTLKRRFPLAEVLIAPASVQGEAAPREIIAGLKNLWTHTVDLILVARGGGSLEDLWAFNDEGVVRAVAGSPVPVISGVGHETDFTLTDFAADVRAPTPTGAAMLATPDITELADTLRQYADRLNSAILTNLIGMKRDLNEVYTRLEHNSPINQVCSQQQTVDFLQERLRQAQRTQIIRQVGWLGTLRARLTALDPMAVLGRGYAVVRTQDNRLISRIAQVAVDQAVNIRLSDGSVTAKVNSIRPDEPTLRQGGLDE